MPKVIYDPFLGTVRLSDAGSLTPEDIGAAPALTIVDCNADATGCVTIELAESGCYYRCVGDVSSLTIAVVDDSKGEVTARFRAGESCSVLLPSDVVWHENSPAEFTAGKTYILSVFDRLAIAAAFGV